MMREPLILAVFVALSVARAPAADVVMAWQESGFHLSIYHDVGRQEILFKKEPVYAGPRVLRGALPVGSTLAEHLPYALDWDRKTLFLDGNRNLDLTDDLPLLAEPTNTSHLVFRRVELGPTPTSNRRYLVDLEFHRPQASYVEIEVLSGWSGTWTRGTATWRAVFADDLDGQWGEGDLFAMAPASVNILEDPASMKLAPMQSLFFDGASHRVSMSPSPDGGWMLSLQETETPMGRLKITGSMIERLALRGREGARVVILDRPGAEPLPVPAGIYEFQHVTLAAGIGRMEAVRREELAVTEGELAELTIGGPLDNTAVVRRDGSSLEMDYALLGRGGEEYDPPPSQSRKGDQRPRVEVFHGKRRVASAHFEYG